MTRTAYEEDDDGFMFSRVKKKKAKDVSKPAPIPEDDAVRHEPQQPRREQPPVESQTLQTEDNRLAPEPAKKRQKKKMSFSTPDASDKQPVRRSKRLSAENQSSPLHRTRRKDGQQSTEAVLEKVPAKEHSPLRVSKTRKTNKSQDAEEVPAGEEPNSDRHSATKIALPFADTPVIKRNKEMRENKGRKGERRSSLSMRGRRASSLIDSGNSNGKYELATESVRLTSQQHCHTMRLK
jgi:kinetochore protein Mis13/DSN1